MRRADPLGEHVAYSDVSPPLPAAVRGSIRRMPAATVDVAAVGFFAALLVLIPGALNFDQAWAVVWAGELLDGGAPSYDAGPTPHPLATALGAIGSLAGPATGGGLLRVLAILSFAAVAWLAVLLGRELAGWWAGVAAALVLLSSGLLLSRTSSSAADVHVMALVMLAVLLEVRSPRRGLPVLALLAVAGLQRPEAWALSGLYWLWLLPGLDTRRRLALLAVAVAAPVIWTLGDLLATGDPLYSFTTTREDPVPPDAAIARPQARIDAPHPLGRPWQSIEVMVEILRSALRLPVLAAAGAGVALALWRRRRRSAPVVAALAAWVGVVWLFGAIGLPLDDRFLFPAIGLLAVFFGAAAVGWAGLEPGRVRTAWALLAVVLVGLVAYSVPARIRYIDRVVELGTARATATGDLRELLARPAVRRVLAGCPTTYTPNYRLRPYAAVAADRPVGTLKAATARTSPAAPGAFIAAESAATRPVLQIGAGQFTGPQPPPAGARVRARNESWSVRTQGC